MSLNPYSWNKVANVLYIEQPAGVGFSYPAGPANDTMTANDTVEAIAAFIGYHPELKGRPLYIAGESYGGHYVPNTAKAIEAWNAEAGQAAPINLKGFAVGNGYADWHLDFNMNVPFGRYHALSSTEQFAAADAACGGDFARCFWPRPDVECPAACDAAVTAAVANAVDGSIDIYDIYEDVCLTPGTERVRTAPFVLEEERRRQLHAMRARNAAASGTVSTTPISPIYPTCVANYNTRYLNLPEVQAAIHVDPSTINPKNHGNWSDCGGESFMYRYILRESCSQFDSLPLTSLTIPLRHRLRLRLRERAAELRDVDGVEGVRHLNLQRRRRLHPQPHGLDQLDYPGAEQLDRSVVAQVARQRRAGSRLLRRVRGTDLSHGEGGGALRAEGPTAPRARHAPQLPRRHSVRCSSCGGDSPARALRDRRARALSVHQPLASLRYLCAYVSTLGACRRKTCRCCIHARCGS